MGCEITGRHFDKGRRPLRVQAYFCATQLFRTEFQCLKDLFYVTSGLHILIERECIPSIIYFCAKHLSLAFSINTFSLMGSKEMHTLWYLSNHFQSVHIKLFKQFSIIFELSSGKD